LNQPSGIPWQQIMETLKWFSIVAIVGGTAAIVFVAVVVYVRKTEKKGLNEIG